MFDLPLRLISSQSCVCGAHVRSMVPCVPKICLIMVGEQPRSIEVRSAWDMIYDDEAKLSNQEKKE